MLLAPLCLALVPSFLGPQELSPFPPTAFDRAVAIQVAPGTLPAGEEVEEPWVEVPIDFSGVLHLWAEGEADLSLRLESDENESLFEDEDSGGGTTPYLRLDVEPGRTLYVLVTAPHAAVSVPATLHLIAAVETESTRAAAAGLGDVLTEVERLLAVGDAPRARKVLESGLAPLQDLPGAEASQCMSDAYWRIGVDWYRAGDPAQAGDAWARTLRHRWRVLPPDHIDTLGTCSNVGTTMWLMGNPRAAEPFLQRALEGFERTRPEGDRQILMVSMNIGSIRRERGDLDSADRILTGVVKGFERILPPGDKLLLDAWQCLAAVRSDRGDFEGARALQERVLEGYERILPENDPDLQRARGNLAHSLDVLGETESARDLFVEVLAVQEKSLAPANRSLLAVRLNLAGVVDSLGDHERARTLLQEAIQACEDVLPPDSPDLLRARSNLADVLAATGDLKGAERLERRVLEGLERSLPEGHRDCLIVRQNLALTELELGEAEAAADLTEELVVQLRGRTLRAGLLAPREARAILDTDRGMEDVCILMLDPADAERGRMVFELVETRRRVATALVANAPRMDRDPELRRLFEDAEAARMDLNDLVLAGTLDALGPEDLRAGIREGTARRDDAERALREALAERGVAIEPVELSAVRQALGQDSAVVAYLRHGALTLEEVKSRVPVVGDRLLAHVVRHDGSLVRVDLGPAAELERLVARWRAALGKPVERGIVPNERSSGDREREAGAALRRRLLDPVLAVLDDSVTELRVVPDDLVYLVSLWTLPLDIAGTEEGIVGDHYRIALLDSLGGLLDPPRSLTGETMLVALGDPAYDTKVPAPVRGAVASPPIEIAQRGHGLPGRFRSLLQTSFELEAVGECFRRAFGRDAVLLRGEEATKVALLAHAGEARFLHLATHGWFAPQAVRSELDPDQGNSKSWRRMGLTENVHGFAPMTLCGLALAGANLGRDAQGRVPGILTAEELCGLDLTACELAVLSACETDVGLRRAGQGMQSLQSAVHAAGARTAITSLWKVDDAVTRKWMELFYDYLWGRGESKLDAMRQASRNLRDGGHPVRDWGAWVLSGDPD